jgi:hypothetical protein
MFCHPDGGRNTNETQQRLAIFFVEFLVWSFLRQDDKKEKTTGENLNQ